MTLEDRAQRASAALRDHVESVEVPDAAVVVRRVRRRRTGAGIVVGACALSVALLVAVLVVRGASGPTRVVTSPATGLPAGSESEQGWALVPKSSAGLGVGTSFDAVASTGRALLLAGQDSGLAATIWRSEDGVHWATARAPVASGSVTAIAAHGDLAVAVGAEGPGNKFGMSNFVWRSRDGGRTWTQVAQGAEVFGSAAPQMGRPNVSGLTWRSGYWIASGGASDGHAGVWASADGIRWAQVLAPNPAGSADVVDGRDGELFAYWVTTGWTTTTPTSWGGSTSLSVPDYLYLQSVAPGAALAAAGDRNHDGPPATPMPLLRSQDGGRTWTVDSSLLNRFPDATVWTITHAGGLWVAAGFSGQPNHPDAWVSADTRTWQALPAGLYGGPGGTLSLVGAIDGRVVLLGTAPELDRFYVFGVTATGGATASASPRACQPGQLAMTFRSGGLGTGGIVVRNIGAEPCRLSGSASLVALDAKQRPLRLLRPLGPSPVPPGLVLSARSPPWVGSQLTPPGVVVAYVQLQGGERDNPRTGQSCSAADEVVPAFWRVSLLGESWTVTNRDPGNGADQPQVRSLYACLRDFNMEGIVPVPS